MLARAAHLALQAGQGLLGGFGLVAGLGSAVARGVNLGFVLFVHLGGGLGALELDQDVLQLALLAA